MITSHFETWEFGSLEWCEYAAELGISLLSKAGLELSNIQWGFSEEYRFLPPRLLNDRKVAGYHLAIVNNKITGGPFIPEYCRNLPGFHVSLEWAMIAHSSYLPFNTVGHVPRGEAHIRLRRELHAVGVGNGRWVLEHSMPGKNFEGETCRACGSPDHDRSSCPIWPVGVGEALGSNPESLNHRWRLKRSPELEEFPESDWGVPLFHEMTKIQKLKFLSLMGAAGQLNLPE